MSERVGPFAAFAHRDYRLLWTGLLISGLGSGMQTLAMGWLVVQVAIRDGVPQLAAVYIGLIGLASSAAGLVAGFSGGVIADRVERRMVLVWAHSVLTAGALALAVLTLAGVFHVAILMAVAAAVAAAQQFDITARQAMLPTIVPPRHLMSALGINTTVTQGSQFLGPLLGGLLIVPLGLTGVFVVDAALRSVIILCLLLMRPQARPLTGAAPNPLRAFVDGFRYVRGDLVILTIIVANAGVSLGGRGFAQLLPAVAHETYHVGAVELSWLLGGAGFGTVAGAFTTAWLGSTRRRGLIYCAGVGGGGLALVLFSLQSSLFAAIPFLALASYGFNLSFGVTAWSVQTRPPNDLRGRVYSIHLMTFNSGSSLGTLAIGALGTAVGISPAIGIGGAVVLATGLVVYARVGAIRGLEDESAPQPAAARA